MKIAYLSYDEPEDLSGVGKKISSQITEWKKNGHEVLHISLRDVPRKSKVPTLNLFLNRRKLSLKIKNFHPDLIYMREVLYFPGLVAMLRGLPVVMEVNSDALAEYKSISYCKYLYHALTRRFLAKSLSGIVSVSSELLRCYRGVFTGPVAVIGNGYDYSKVSVVDNLAVGPLSFVFVGSPNQAWHGVDEIEKLAVQLPNCQFHIVSPNYSSSISNVYAHGALYGEALSNMYRSVDVAIGSLSLHRKCMNEASPLKVREYLAYGLPTIIGYCDTDLSEFDEKDGVLSIDNKPDSAALNAERIKSFALSWRGRRVPHSKTYNYLSYQKKELIRLDFMRQVLGNV